MSKITYHVGIDISSEDFAASILRSPDEPIITKESIKNSIDGFEELLLWLRENNADTSNTVICMEATGVYAESLCHFLVSKGFQVAVEPPLKVKRAFHPQGHKTDPVDSRQIAEYTYRFSDELKFWKPREEILEKVRQLLTAREQFTKQSTALKNSLTTFQREVVQTPLVIQAHQKTLEQLRKNIEAIDREINRLLDENPAFRQMVNHLKSIPGVGLLLAANLMVITNGFAGFLNVRQLAAYIGICPYKHRSGKTVYKKDRSSGLGPPVLRKLLHLAARSVSTHHYSFRGYYLRKLEEGKDKRLVLNNLSNKLLKIMCAVVNNNTPFMTNYKSVNPILLQGA